MNDRPSTDHASSSLAASYIDQAVKQITAYKQDADSPTLVLRWKKEVADAERVFKDTIVVDPHWNERQQEVWAVRCNLAGAFHDAGQYAECIAECSQIIEKLGSGHPWLHHMLQLRAAAYSATGSQAQARQDNKAAENALEAAKRKAPKGCSMRLLTGLLSLVLIGILIHLLPPNLERWFEGPASLGVFLVFWWISYSISIRVVRKRQQSQVQE